jgi:CBS domain-containing protein
MSLEFRDTELKVGDIMTETIISVGPHGTVGLAIQEMARYKISCIIVATAGRAVGILTERDVLRGIATRYSDFVRATIAEEMSRPVISVDPNTTVLAASKLMACKNIKRLLVVREQHPVGVVTQTDVTSALISMSPFRDIASLMTRDVVTVGETATMTEAAQLMAAGNISCVVILRGNRAVGIATERDVLQHVALSRDDPSTTPVTEIMSSAIVTVSPTHSVMSASRMMDQMRIHTLLVGSITDIQGIVTQTDIIAAVQSKLEEARQARLQSESDMGRLANSAMTNLSSIQGLFQEILCHHELVGESAKTAESRENAASRRSAICDRDQDEAALHDRILKELETQILQTQDSLARLASMVGVPTSRKSTLTTADHLSGVSEIGA